MVQGVSHTSNDYLSVKAIRVLSPPRAAHRGEMGSGADNGEKLRLEAGETWQSTAQTF